MIRQSMVLKLTVIKNFINKEAGDKSPAFAMCIILYG